MDKKFFREQQSIAQRFEYLNQLYRNKSESLKKPDLTELEPREYASAPIILIHDPIKTQYKVPSAFTYSGPSSPPSIHLDSILCVCTLDQLQDAKNVDDIRDVFGNLKYDPMTFSSRQQRQVMINLLSSAYVYCKYHDFSDHAVDITVKIFYYTHQYFIASLWHTADDIYEYFKEFLTLYCVNNPPKSELVFTPLEAQKIILHLCRIYIRFLPLLKAICLPNYKIHLQLPEPPPPPPPAKPKKEGKKKK